ncbi:MAG: hypothetical protein HOE69_04390 [Euryarchaeota archaeon]|jgi:immune inhibitor A|nr:hypothetical protein [Euryarchaeota archaeon]
MKPILAIPIAAMIMAAGWYVSEDPTRLGPVFEYLDDYTSQVENSAPLVKMQEDERWLVVVVDFPNAPENGFRNVNKANTLLTGTNGADDYINQASGGATTLSVSIVPDVYHAQNHDSYWGEDDGNLRDVGQEGTDGPAGLAASVIKNSLVGIDLSPYDLNSDGWIDRFLIIHTADVQEDGGGGNSIWSHYGPLTEMIEINGFKVDHYTIAGFDSGFGTIVHEMLHQMGALDLYDVHGQGTADDWNGLGDWDVMAGGNWNGVNGRTPALPSLGTLDLIGVQRATEVSLSMVGESQEYLLSPLSSGGTGLSIEISPNERVWMSYRADVGFDKELPGHGLLVTVQDLAVGDMEQNLVNTNPEIPWLYVLEADGDSGLLSGNNEGDSSDVFTVGEKFGAEGIILVDHHGRQVTWTVEVTSMDANSLGISISTTGIATFEILPPHQPIQLLKDEDLLISVNSSTACTLSENLISSDGRNASILESTPLTPGLSEIRTIRWDSFGIVGGEARLTGNFSCGASPNLSVDIVFYNIGLRLENGLFAGDVAVDGVSYSEIQLQFTGLGDQVWEVRLEGPVERIATTDTTQTLGDGSVINLSIEPNGLLVPGMVARGEIVIRDSQGLEQSVEISLTAEQFEQGGEIVRFFSDPSNLILTMAGLLALSVLLGMRTKKSQVDKIRAAGRKKAAIQSKGGGQIRPAANPQSQFSAQPQSTTHQVSGPDDYEKELLELANVNSRPRSISDGVEISSGPDRPGNKPTMHHKVGVINDPNEIPDLDDFY